MTSEESPPGRDYHYIPGLWYITRHVHTYHNDSNIYHTMTLIYTTMTLIYTTMTLIYTIMTLIYTTMTLIYKSYIYIILSTSNRIPTRRQ